ncbi:hypothetical protein [Demequina maris]|uniref:hypothetical protein n=1 Tax=Demequina maris TaxID=1638982 RepID=UPI00078219F5|nr:hypothetical protein [Demequina maris]
MRWQEILDRFRPATAPGGAAESAAHAAARTGIAVELAPVFAALDEDLAAAAALAASGEAGAEERVARARAAGAEVIAAARAEAPAREAVAATAVREAAATGDARLLEEAQARAHALQAERSPRIDEAADAVVNRLVAGLRGTS